MSEEPDRTEEIPRGDGRRVPAQEPQQGPAPTPDRPYRPQQQPQPQSQWAPQRSYPPERPAEPASYPPAMVPSGRGSSGFPAAVTAAVVAAGVAVLTAFGSYRILRDHSGMDPNKVPGYVTYRAGLLPWPASGAGRLSTGLIVGAVTLLILALVLMMAVTLSTRAGTGGFAVFLAGWMATVLAAAVARSVAAAVAQPDGQDLTLSAVLQTHIPVGLTWGLLFGWISALVLLIGHQVRRKVAGGAP